MEEECIGAQNQSLERRNGGVKGRRRRERKKQQWGGGEALDCGIDLQKITMPQLML